MASEPRSIRSCSSSSDGGASNPDPENSGTAPAGERARLAQSQRLRSGSGSREAKRFGDHVETIGAHLTEKLEGEVETLVVHPAHRPVAAPEIGQQIQNLAPGGVRDRHRRKEPHQSGSWDARASSPPRR